jgi:hypothetical protein
MYCDHGGKDTTLFMFGHLGKLSNVGQSKFRRTEYSYVPEGHEVGHLRGRVFGRIGLPSDSNL